MKHRALVFGVGKMANWWLNGFLPDISDRCEVVGLVDTSEAALRQHGTPRALWPQACYSSIAEAFDAVDTGLIDASCAFVILPPEAHAEAVLGCMSRNIPVLSEKPLSDSPSECVAIARALTDSHKVAVVQNYRHSAGVQAARRLVADGAIGRLYSVAARFRADYREFGSWDGPARHQVLHPVLLDGAIHHLDLLRFLTGAEFERLVCEEWKPPQVDSFAGGCCVNVIARMTGGVRATYEANVVCGGELRSWTGEEFRLEGADGALHVIGERLWTERLVDGVLVKEELPLEPMQHRWHLKTIVDFLDWLDGEDVEVVTVDDNLGSLRAMFAAVKSAEDAAWVHVEAVGMNV